MKTSTALSMAIFSVSCYAAPLHTGDSPGNAALNAETAQTMLAVRANAAPVSAPAPDVIAQALDHAHWSHVPLPKSHSPNHGMASQQIDVQT